MSVYTQASSSSVAKDLGATSLENDARNYRGEVALEFCEARSKSGEVYASQNPSVTVQKQRTVLFFHCVRFPSSYYRAKLKERVKTLSFNFGGLEGNRTPVRKPLDMTFSVGSQFLLFPTTYRQRTGNAQSVAPLCLIGSGATTDASSPLRSRSVRSRGPLRRNG